MLRGAAVSRLPPGLDGSRRLRRGARGGARRMHPERTSGISLRRRGRPTRREPPASTRRRGEVDSRETRSRPATPSTTQSGVEAPAREAHRPAARRTTRAGARPPSRRARCAAGCPRQISARGGGCWRCSSRPPPPPRRPRERARGRRACRSSVSLQMVFTARTSLCRRASAPTTRSNSAPMQVVWAMTATFLAESSGMRAAGLHDRAGPLGVGHDALRSPRGSRRRR